MLFLQFFKLAAIKASSEPSVTYRAAGQVSCHYQRVVGGRARYEEKQKTVRSLRLFGK
jgi:hypothetical protein